MLFSSTCLVYSSDAQWVADPAVNLPITSEHATYPKSVWTSDSSLTIVYEALSGVHGQRLSKAGILEWPEPTVFLDSVAAYEFDVEQTDNGTIAVGANAGLGYVHAIELSESGTPTGYGWKVPLHEPRNPRLRSSHGLEFLLYSAGNYDKVLALDAAGKPLWDSAFDLDTVRAGSRFGRAYTHPDSGIVVIYGRDSNAFAQWILPSGRYGWASDGQPLFARSLESLSSLADSSGSFFCLINEKRPLNNSTSRVWVQKVSPAGKPLWGSSGISVCPITPYHIGPRMQSDGTGGIYVLWMNWLQERVLRIQRIRADGTEAWAQPGIVVPSGIETPILDAVPDDSGGLFFCWVDVRRHLQTGEGMQDILLQHVDSNGSFSFDSAGVPISLAPERQTNPRLYKLGQRLLVTWMDSRGDFVRVYANGVYTDGVALGTKLSTSVHCEQMQTLDSFQIVGSTLVVDHKLIGGEVSLFDYLGRKVQVFRVTQDRTELPVRIGNPYYSVYTNGRKRFIRRFQAIP